MTEPAADITLTPLDLLARQNQTIEALIRGLESVQIEIEALRRRVQVLEGVPWPEAEPPGSE